MTREDIELMDAQLNRLAERPEITWEQYNDLLSTARQGAELLDYLKRESAETEARIAEGKGTWPEKNYVRDEDWARLLSRAATLERAIFFASATLSVRRNASEAE